MFGYINDPELYEIIVNGCKDCPLYAWDEKMCIKTNRIFERNVYSNIRQKNCPLPLIIGQVNTFKIMISEHPYSDKE